MDIWIDTIREYDTSGQTGENGVTDWKLPSEAQDFDKASFRAEDGYWIFENSDGSEQLKLPILSVKAGMERENSSGTDRRGDRCLCSRTEAGNPDKSRSCL